VGVYWGYFHPPTYRITIPDIRSGTISAAAVSGVSGKFSKRLSPSNVSVRLDHPTDAGSPMPPMPVGKKFLGDLRRKLDKKWLLFYLPSESWIHDPGT